MTAEPTNGGTYIYDPDETPRPPTVERLATVELLAIRALLQDGWIVCAEPWGWSAQPPVLQHWGST